MAFDKILLFFLSPGSNRRTSVDWRRADCGGADWRIARGRSYPSVGYANWEIGRSFRLSRNDSRWKSGSAIESRSLNHFRALDNFKINQQPGRLGCARTSLITRLLGSGLFFETDQKRGHRGGEVLKRADRFSFPFREFKTFYLSEGSRPRIVPKWKTNEKDVRRETFRPKDSAKPNRSSSSNEADNSFRSIDQRKAKQTNREPFPSVSVS